MKKFVSWVIAVSLLLCVFFVDAELISCAVEPYLTRGELALLFVENLDLKYDSTMTIPYKDVPESSPYYEAICVCHNMGIMTNASTSNLFLPNSTFERSTLADYLYKTGLPLAQPETTPPDVSESNYAINAAIALGVLEVNKNGKFNPNILAYASDINFTALNAALAPSTTYAANLDLINGSITVCENVKGVNVFSQGKNIICTTADSGIIRQTDSATATTNSITVNRGTVALTVSGLNIASASGPPISVADGASLTLTILGENVLKATNICAGIHIPEGAELIVRGTGSLDVTGGMYGAGIGGGGYVTTISYGTNTIITSTDLDGKNGTIIIAGGTIISTGGEYGAGIGGGGRNSDGGNITISGATVTATGGYLGSGIGGGSAGDGGNITINDSTVIAKVGSYAAGIGGGCNGNGGDVKISSSTVRAIGYYWAIGGGNAANEYGCTSIDIEDNTTVDLTYNAIFGHGELQENIYISKQPLDAAAHIKNEVKLALDAYGYSGLSCQWQVSSDNSTWTDVDGQTSANASIPMSAANDGYYYRCKLTNGWGNVIYSDTVQAHVLAFTKQPESVDAAIDDIVSFAVTPICSNVTYKWQRSYDDGATWFDVEDETYATLIVSASLSTSSAKYRCVITATNGDTLASDIVEIKLDTGNMVTYTAQYYLQKADGSGYVLKDQEVLDGVSGETATAPVASYVGFSENTSKSTVSGTIANDSSLILTRYYDRNTYSITFEMNGGSAFPAIEALYEAPVTAPDEPSRYGYTFAGWYADADFEEEYVFDTMPLGGATAYAKWELIGADRGVEYHVNGLSLRSSENYETLDSIPNTAFFVEVSVTNLCADATDTIIIAYYKENGQFIGMQYLYAKSQVGQTLTFGSYIDNTKGDIATIKAFVLPTLGSPIPLANSAEVK